MRANTLKKATIWKLTASLLTAFMMIHYSLIIFEESVLRKILPLLLILCFPQVVLASDCLKTPNENGCRAGLPEDTYDALLEEMARYSEPEVRSLEPNRDEIYRYAYWRLDAPNGITIYNAPGGSPIKVLDPGYHYVSAYSYQDGWVEINPGQWVRDDDHTYGVRPSEFAGVFLDKDDLKYPMLWVLVNSYPSPYPGAEPDKTAAVIPRYTRASIFATVRVDGWEWYLVSPDHWIKQTEVARVKLSEKPSEVEGRWVAVDLYEQVLVAYEEETPIFATLIASGLPQWSTNEGTFRTASRKEDAPMSGAEGQSDFYRLENVPYAMYFDGKISLHGTYWHDRFGYRQSHGCVNMSITDAYWLYHWTLDAGYEQFWVHVFSSGEYQ